MAVAALGSAPRVKVAPWNDPVIRGWVFQIVVVGLVGALAWYLVSNTIDNLNRQKIASGFDYLGREAGFESGDSMIAYSPASTYARAIWVGILNTLRVAILGIILSTLLGTLIGVGRLSPNWLLNKICAWYVEAFRNVPLLVQLFIWYFLVPDLLPTPLEMWFKQGISPATSAYLSVVVCLGLFTAARVCEQVRTGIQALPRGQNNAALAMGFTTAQTYRFVLLPQAFRVIIPPLTSEFLNIFKNSSVASLIGLMELLAQTKQTAEFSANIFEAFTLATLIYFVLNMSLMGFMAWVEKRVRIPGMMGGSK